MTSLPPPVARFVAHRRAEMAPWLRDRALDLDLPDALAEVEAVQRGAPVDHPYPVIVSTVALPRFPDLLAVLSALRTLLAPGGRLLLVEPVAHLGPAHRLRATAWAAHPACRGLHLSRDPVAVARVAGLTFTDLERTTMPTPIRPFRHMVTAIAAHPFVPSAPAAAGGVA